MVFRLNPCGITGAGREGVNDPLARGAGTGVETGVGEGVGIEDVDEMLSFIDWFSLLFESSEWTLTSSGYKVFSEDFIICLGCVYIIFGIIN